MAVNHPRRKPTRWFESSSWSHAHDVPWWERRHDKPDLVGFDSHRAHHVAFFQTARKPASQAGNAGSIPARDTIIGLGGESCWGRPRIRSSTDRALGYGPRGCRFKSCRMYQWDAARGSRRRSPKPIETGSIPSRLAAAPSSGRARPFHKRRGARFESARCYLRQAPRIGREGRTPPAGPLSGE